MMSYLKTALAFVFIGSISFFTYTMHSWHMVDYAPNEVHKLKTLTSLTNKMGAIHFLTPACGCSSEVLEHLMSRQPLNDSNLEEFVVLVDDFGGHYTNQLKERTYKVIQISSHEKSDISEAIKGVPLFVIFDEKNTIQYVGGYSEQLINPMTVIDVKPLISQIKNKQKTKALPVKGCAVSERYKKLLDPMGVKYATSTK